MKFTNLLSILTLAVLVISFSGCGDDDDEISAKGNFTVGGSTYNLDKAVAIDYGSFGAGYDDVDLIISSSGVSYNSAISDFTGSGDVLYLDLNVNPGGGVENGTYTFGNTRDVGVMSYGDVYVNVNLENETFDATYTVNSGTVVVSSASGGNKTISFSLQTSDGVSTQTVTGSYTGSVVVFED